MIHSLSQNFKTVQTIKMQLSASHGQVCMIILLTRVLHFIVTTIINAKQFQLNFLSSTKLYSWQIYQLYCQKHVHFLLSAPSLQIDGVNDQCQKQSISN